LDFLYLLKPDFGFSYIIPFFFTFCPLKVSFVVSSYII